MNIPKFRISQFRTMSSISTFALSALPLPSASHTLTRNLTPDPDTPSPAEFHKLREQKPSLQRRARVLADPAHFSYVAPLPIAFPYRIEPKDGEEVTDKTAFIERWLTQREALHEEPSVSRVGPQTLNKYYPIENIRNQPLELIGLAETGLKDCLPHLDVGDAFETIGAPTLVDSRSFEDVPEKAAQSTEDMAARQELIEVLSGHAVLANSDPNSENPWAPWSLRYSGHQFGVWAGQLGDGRAISILATPHPSQQDTTYELQLKGAGRTPFSRSADGLAVLRSSIREFLGAEAIHALGIPTTRSLSLIHLPALPVLREKLETGCVLTRLAPSFLRIGNFQAMNAPEKLFFFGPGGQQDANLEGLRLLGEWVGQRVLKLEGVKWREEGQERGDPWGRKLVLEVARRNAEMVAGWQAYGFMHGVMNTDNISVLGLTIDYGPYAFMDVFDEYHICNHSDEEGRYAYNAQPSMIIYALRALTTSLAPLIGAESSLGHAATPDLLGNASNEDIASWKKNVEDAGVYKEVEDLIKDVCGKEYRRLMHKRLGLKRIEPNTEGKLTKPLLDIMSTHKLDFHSTFRRLAYFRPSLLSQPSVELDEYIAGVLTLTPDPAALDTARATEDLKEWLKRYAQRISDEREEWGNDEAEVDRARTEAIKTANPRFVLRQWVLEEVIRKVERDTDSGKRILSKVLEMACRPFDSWGAEDDPSPDGLLSDEIKEERRYCGMGERKMLGFQCSCSS